ncbi:MAG: ATP-binding cassette domain-containing protein [Olsenella sp.]|jgi:ABC-type lipoprotein export system ATPase subunit/ABC-type antimicrobial peptide transport system permease subunit|nr:ATP-binding cassette domain-containing protein [Olsenella sp.]MCI1792775.1 ATP-binding cassette domain-containing protein [Olsenella sp.]MCI1810837.1 ATP-binding cassette domain-containing protein [Olsenella sp.]MCI1878908.1 ATP-binding cassette domain-containing protein [Olsenella sp.]
MLELRDISKKYVTGSFTQVALDHVSVAFRDSEFVAILGPSGSGKTTMLNVVGGLDHFDSGDLLVDGISTKRFRDRDWDAYRNNRIGFVFQSYNLIPHQTILANVELALTLSGVSRSERRRRALKALADVGLADHVDKRPAQLSGGQMQRVAIARALINDPEILLADEPTGALDSATSVQVMDLLKEVSRDRLVVMVTHNPELARQYATRIVELRDGHITSDSAPFTSELEEERRPAKPTRKTSMSFLTALGLSFNNLMTKKGRTFLTAFAGSIGIIGIAAILALSNGANNYIRDTEEEMLTVYPLTIEGTSLNLTSVLSSVSGSGGSSSSGNPLAAGKAQRVEGSDSIEEASTITNMFKSVGKNDLKSLKAYLDANGGGIDTYAHAIQYSYDATPYLYLQKDDGTVVQVNPESSFMQLGSGVSSSITSNMTSQTSAFHELLDDTDLIEGQYDLVAGKWPTNADELLVVLRPDGTIPDLDAFELGLRDHSQLDYMVSTLTQSTTSADEESAIDESEGSSYPVSDILASKLKLVYPSDVYSYDSGYGVWIDRSDDDAFMQELVSQGMDVKVAGIVQAKDSSSSLSPGIYYTSGLTRQVMDHAAKSEIVKQQLADPATDVFMGKTFLEEAAGASEENIDLSNLFNVDADALKASFSFDTSKLNLDLSTLDMSDMATPQVDVPALDLSGIDFSGVDFSGIDVSKLDTQELQELVPDFSDVDWASIISNLDIKYDQSAADALMSQLTTEYQAYMREHPNANPQDYFLSEQGRQAIETGVEKIVNFDDIQRQLKEQLEPIVDEKVSDSVAKALKSQIVQQLASQIASQLEAQITNALTSYVQTAMTQVMGQVSAALQTQLSSALKTSMDKLAGSFASAMSVDTDKIRSAFSLNVDETQLRELMMSMLTNSSASYDDNLVKLGYADPEAPSEIDIYPGDFDDKEQIIRILDEYNDSQTDEAKKITYTDLVGTLMQSVTRIVNMISYLLIAFVSISLIVSSIMIAVITYISVLERKKEIGILRSIGASKHNVSSVFNAETVIEGLVSGVMGIAITLAASIPVNSYVFNRYAVSNIMQLSWQHALILIGISVLLTFLAGLIPASKASREDPVEALRSE